MKKKDTKISIYRTDKMIDFVELEKKEPELFEDLLKDYPLKEGLLMIEVVKNA